jgi:flagellar biosynthetic protein FlhB
MAEDQGQLRTEEPTPRRREEAAKTGQIAFSPELTSAAVIVAAVLFLLLMGPPTGGRLLGLFRTELAAAPERELDISRVREIAEHQFGRFVAAIGPIFAVLAAAAITACVAQMGFRFLPDKLAPDFDRISPATGFSRVFSLQSIQRAFLAIVKAAAVVAVAVLLIRNRSGAILGMNHAGIDEAVASGWGVFVRLIIYLAGILAVVGAIDYVFQWRRVESALRMTRQEVKEEARMHEGDPLMRARIRTLQRQRARQRTMAAVKSATVVVTNPTHYAVALRYDRSKDRAPVVVAKGAGWVAHQIADLARRHAIPVLERPPIARALYATVKEGREIPAELFRAVAEVIAFVLKLRGAA